MSSFRTVASLICFVGGTLTGCATELETDVADVSAPRVTVEQGTLSGTRDDDLRVFRGIPYAAPPTGEHRWASPQPPYPYDGVRDASAFGPACMQAALPRRSLYYSPLESVSEDCLTLNVWAEAEASDAPVIVWIHGGSLRMGSSSDPLYEGSEFARRGAVFVSINYRLGALGWLAHPELSAESETGISGNYGLQDQIAALKWVKANIDQFGGDPDNITIMGESAGALSVTYLMSSPPAQGLFDKAIVQSTNSRNFPQLSEPSYGLASAEQTGVDFLTSMGAEDVDTARALDGQAIADHAMRARFAAQGTVDGRYLPRQLVEIFDAGDFARVPVLVGFTSGESRSYRAFLPPKPATGRAYRDAIEVRYGDLSDDLLALYPESDIDGSMLAILRDALFGWGTERVAVKATEHGENAFFYLFDYCYPSASARDLCAFHASELPFVFGRTDEDDLPPNWPAPDGPSDTLISEALLDYWTSFAATGQPTSAQGPDWAPYANAQSYLHISETLDVRSDPLPGMYELHETLVKEREAAGQSWFIDVGVAAPPRP